MSVQRKTHNATRASNLGVQRVVTLLAIIALAFSVLWVAATASESAHATLYDTDDAAQVEGDSADTTASDEESVQVEGVVVDDGSEAASNSEETLIEDAENPMSSGLEGTVYDHSSGVPLYLIVALAIAGVVAFFVTSTRRLNADIIKMNRKIR